jgi:hypothetical protein
MRALPYYLDEQGRVQIVSAKTEPGPTFSFKSGLGLSV